jgi:hypothetical protein
LDNNQKIAFFFSLFMFLSDLNLSILFRFISVLVQIPHYAPAKKLKIGTRIPGQPMIQKILNFYGVIKSWNQHTVFKKNRQGTATKKNEILWNGPWQMEKFATIPIRSKISSITCKPVNLVLFLFIMKNQILNYKCLKSRLNYSIILKFRHSSNSDITFFMCGFETKDRLPVKKCSMLLKVDRYIF